MPFVLSPLPYERDALAPYISAETIDYHYGKHHQGYVNNLNKLLLGSDFVGESLENIVRQSPKGPLFNNAAQVWNHSFYWECLSPQGGREPTGILAVEIQRAFGSFTTFKQQFTDSAINNFGSGWTWLVLTANDQLAIRNTSNAESPLTAKEIPLLTVDIWEHAYYVDYRNARPDYLKAFWSLVNWNFVKRNFEQ